MLHCLIIIIIRLFLTMKCSLMSEAWGGGTDTATGSLNFPHCCIWNIRSPPLMYSMTKYSRSIVWKHECSWTRNGGLWERASTRFSTIAHSTSSSWSMRDRVYTSNIVYWNSYIERENKPLWRQQQQIVSRHTYHKRMLMYVCNLLRR